MERDRSGSHLIAYDFLKESAKNLLMGFEAVRRFRLRRPRSFVEGGTPLEFLQSSAFYTLGALEEYAGGVAGKSVCEFGPGDFLTSGLAILAAGADRYTAIDRFPGDHSGERAKYWYGQLREHWSHFRPGIHWDPALVPESFPEGYVGRVEIVSKPLEEVHLSRRFDIVCSFQVGEHVTDIQAFAGIHQRLLEPSGVGLHRIDFGPHDVWFRYRDPSVFLRFSERLWRLTGSNRGVPNRRRHHEFLDAFERAGLNVHVLFTDRFDENVMDLSKLDRRFREMPHESLVVGTAIYRITRRET